MKHSFVRTYGIIYSLLFATGLLTATAEASTQIPQWKHPGVLISKEQLDFISQKVNSHESPFYNEFLLASASPEGSKTYTVKGPYPGGINQCGFPSYSPNHGCSAANRDSSAAYIQALLWYITENPIYAKNAINIMNTYAKNLKGFAGYTPGYPCPGFWKSCANAPLQAAWDTEKWPRAAEIIRYGHNGKAGWSPTDVAAFSAMLKNVYLPLIYNQKQSNANWGLSQIEGMMGIAVFTEDKALLQHAQSVWKQRVPAYFYNFNLDNALYPGTHVPLPPIPFATWYGQTLFNASTTGVEVETCRDLGHAEFGIDAAINTAETDYIQTDLSANLYTANGAAERLITSLNLMSGLERAASTTAPPGFCSGAGNKIILGDGISYVLGYNHYHNRLHNPMMADKTGSSGLRGTANTWNWIHHHLLPLKNQNPGNHMQIFELLTHYDSYESSQPTTSITVTADNKSIHQNQPLPTFTWTVKPNITLTTNPVCKTTATSASPVGSYPITCSNAAKSGYTFNYIPGVLTINSSSDTACNILSAKIIQQSNWGSRVVNKFAITVSLQGFLSQSGSIPLTGVLTMKNSFMQNFWGDFTMSPSFTGAVGKFTGNSSKNTINLYGFINNTIPMNTGSNPLNSLVLNQITCH